MWLYFVIVASITEVEESDATAKWFTEIHIIKNHLVLYNK